MPYGSIIDNNQGRYQLSVTVPIAGGTVGSVAMVLVIQDDFGDPTQADFDKAVQALIDILDASFTFTDGQKIYAGVQPITAD